MKEIMTYDEFLAYSDNSWLRELDTYENGISIARKFILRNKLFSQFLNKYTQAELLNSIFNSEKARAIIREMLTVESQTRTTDSWRGLRRNIAVLAKAVKCDEYADNLEYFKNPTAVALRQRNTQKDDRMKRVDQKDLDKVAADCRSRSDEISCSLLTIGQYTGARPCEMNRIEVMDIDIEERTMTLYIEDTKNTLKAKIANGPQRGICREITIKLPDTEALVDLSTAILSVEDLTKREIDNARERIRKSGRRIFSRRKTNFTLYTLRYMMGSNLKFNNQHRQDKRRMIAGVMGHLCTSSAKKYGNIQSGIRTSIPVASKETVAQVKDNVDVSIAAIKVASRKKGKTKTPSSEMNL